MEFPSIGGVCQFFVIVVRGINRRGRRGAQRNMKVDEVTEKIMGSAIEP